MDTAEDLGTDIVPAGQNLPTSLGSQLPAILSRAARAAAEEDQAQYRREDIDLCLELVNRR